MWKTPAILLISFISFSAWAEPVPQLTEYIDQKLLVRFLSDKTTFTLVDARTPEEYQTQHINGAINIPHDRLGKFDQYLPTDMSAPIVVYCRTGERAGLLRDALVAAGYSNVMLLPAVQIFWSTEAPPVFNCGFNLPSREHSFLSSEQKPAPQHQSIEEN